MLACTAQNKMQLLSLRAIKFTHPWTFINSSIVVAMFMNPFALKRTMHTCLASEKAFHCLSYYFSLWVLYLFLPQCSFRHSYTKCYMSFPSAEDWMSTIITFLIFWRKMLSNEMKQNSLDRRSWKASLTP